MSKALVVLSGGQDSTTCLYWAKKNFGEVKAITFDYGQRHFREIRSARDIARFAKVPHEIVDLAPGILKGTSPLVNPEARLEQYPDHESLPGGLEKTFVPMRNQLFLTIAANRAYIDGCNVLITGLSAEDYGGYPDCREDFVEAMVRASSLGAFTGKDGAPGTLRILTPLMHKSKHATVEMALLLSDCYTALALSHTAYDGNPIPNGKDHASLLRAKGFEEADVPDPLVLFHWQLGNMMLPTMVNYRDERVSAFMPEITKALQFRKDNF